MAGKITFNSLLVPTDFTENSWSAFEYALRLVDGDESEIVVVHAIDPTLVDQFADFHGGTHDDVLAGLREKAKQQMTRYSEKSDKVSNVDPLICEGEPFFEIIKKAEDFAVDAIVMSKFGQRNHANSLLFGSTAEKVARGSKLPVIILPGA